MASFSALFIRAFSDGDYEVINFGLGQAEEKFWSMRRLVCCKG